MEFINNNVIHILSIIQRNYFIFECYYFSTRQYLLSWISNQPELTQYDIVFYKGFKFNNVQYLFKSIKLCNIFTLDRIIKLLVFIFLNRIRIH